jgi:hypothetical protein
MHKREILMISFISTPPHPFGLRYRRLGAGPSFDTSGRSERPPQGERVSASVLQIVKSNVLKP